MNHAVLFILSDSPASEFHVPTFRNTLSVPSSLGDVNRRNEEGRMRNQEYMNRHSFCVFCYMTRSS